MNLHVDHTPDCIAKTADDFRRLIDCAIEFGGSYFLTYHRWASRSRVETCHPRMVEFLRAKRRHDPAEAFQGDWYRHYKRMFADQLLGPFERRLARLVPASVGRQPNS